MITGNFERASSDVIDIVEEAGDAVAAVKASALTAQGTIAALNAERVNSILDNTEQLTKTASNAASKLDEALSTDTLGNMQKTIQDANATMASIRKTVESLEGSVDYTRLAVLLGILKSTGASSALEEFDGIAIGGVLTDNAIGVATRADNVLRNAENVAAVKPENITKVTDSIEQAALKAEQAATSVAKAGDAAAQLGDAIAAKTPEIEQTITQASQFMGRINTASLRIDDILPNLTLLAVVIPKILPVTLVRRWKLSPPCDYAQWPCCTNRRWFIAIHPNRP